MLTYIIFTLIHHHVVCTYKDDVLTKIICLEKRKNKKKKGKMKNETIEKWNKEPFRFRVH